MTAPSERPGDADAAAPPTRGEWLALAGLLLFALALRLAELQQIHAHDPFFALPSVDERMYHEWALAIARGDWLGQDVFLNGPLYPYFLALVYRLFGESPLAAKAVQCVLGTATCALVWAIARRLFDRRVAFLAGALASVYAMAIFYEGTLLVTNLATPLAALCVYAAVAALDAPSARRWWAAGLAVGVSALARPNALLFAALLAAWLFPALRDRAPLRRRAGWAGAFAAGVAACVLPVTARNAWVGGDFVLVTYATGLNLYVGNHPGADGSFRVPRIFPRSAADDPWEQRAAFRAYAERAEGRKLEPSEVSAYWTRQTLRAVRDDPGRWLRLEARKLALAVNHFEPWNNRSITLSREASWLLRLPLLRFGALAPLAFLGIALSLRRWRRLVPLYAQLVTVGATLLVFFVLARYRMPAMPVLAVFAAFGLVGTFDAVAARRWRGLAAALALTGLFAVAVERTVVSEDLSIAWYNLANRYKKLGDWERAVHTYQRALRGQPRYLSAWNNLAVTYEAMGRHDTEATAAWERVRALGQAQGLARYVERADRHLAALHARAVP